MLKRLKETFDKKVLSAELRKGMAILLCVSFIVSACCGYAYAAPRSFEDTTNNVNTVSANFGRVLLDQGIVLGAGEKVNVSLSTADIMGKSFKIDGAFPVTIDYLGEKRVFFTTKKMVSDVLFEAKITVDHNDIVAPKLTETVEKGDVISITTVDVQNITVQESIAFETIEKENPEMSSGERKVVQEGRLGTIETEYSIVYNDGEEVLRSVVRELTLSEPVTEIVEYGTRDEFELGAVPAYKPTNYSSVQTFTATAYDASPADNGPWAGMTSTGMPLKYGVIAVDPRVIPYGTKMYIESVDGEYVYGYAIAGDCGGAIKGNRVDLFFNSRSQCFNFGRRDVRIYFLN